MTPSILIVPGLRDHVEDHWQTLLAAKIPGASTVPPLQEDKLSRAARGPALDAAFARLSGPVVLVAHSAGVLTAVHCAQSHGRQLHGAVRGPPAGIGHP